MIELDGPAVRQLCQRDPVLGNEVTQRLMRVLVDRLYATRRRLADSDAECAIPAQPAGPRD